MSDPGGWLSHIAKYDFAPAKFKKNTESSPYLITQLLDSIRAVVITFPSFTSAGFNRKALTGQLPDDVRAVEVQFSLCDDFVPQFAMASDLGRQFNDAWFAARQILDLGRRASKPAAPPASPPHP